MEQEVDRGRGRGNARSQRLRTPLVAQDFSPACSGPDSSGQFTFELSLKITNESSARPDEVIKSLLGPDAKIIEIKRTKIMY